MKPLWLTCKVMWPCKLSQDFWSILLIQMITCAFPGLIPGWITRDGLAHSYMLSFRGADWAEAIEYCKAEGAILAEPRTQAELDFIVGLSSNLWDLKIIKPCLLSMSSLFLFISNNVIWVGIHDLHEEGRWNCSGHNVNIASCVSFS